MSAPEMRGRLTLEEYLEFDRTSEGRWEYVDGEIFEKSGVQPVHAELEASFGSLLNRSVASRGCSVYAANLRIRVPGLPPYRYADLSALCAPPEFEVIGGIQCLINPELIVEILSPPTEAYDLGEKFLGYKTIPSLREYVVVRQNRKLVVLFARHSERFWLMSEYGEGEAFRLESLGCEISVDELYAGIEFQAEPEASGE